MPLKVVPLKGSPNWYLRGTVRGVSVFETTGTSDRDAAEAIRVRREKEILDESIHGPRVSRTFAEAAVIHMERPGASLHERRFIFPLVDAWGDMLCRDIGQEQIDRFVRKHYRDAKPSTILRQVVTPATAVLKTAARRKWCDDPKFDRPKVKKPRKRAMTHEEFAALYAEAVPHLKPLLVFLVYTGARMAEALELEWRHVNLADRWAVLEKTKTDDPRGVPLHAEVVTALANLPRRKGKDGQPLPRSGRVFLSHRGEPYADKQRKSGGQIKTGWRNACKRAGVLGYTPHELRHTFSTWAVMAGMHPHDKDEIMGHAATEMSRHYTHLPQPHLVRAIDLLPGLDREISVKPSKAKPGKRNDLKKVARR